MWPLSVLTGQMIEWVSLQENALAFCQDKRRVLHPYPQTPPLPILKNHINDMILRQGSTVQHTLFVFKILLQCDKVEVSVNEQSC